MSRWHAPSCSNPRVVVQQQRPYCESCDSHPDIDALIAAEASKASSIPFLPPDEPPGQMHLWWPPCVPYVTKGPDGHPIPIRPPEDKMPASTPDEDESSWNAYNRHIYPQRLKMGEFRVMCLYAVDDVNHPIQVSLEVNDDLRYHEYETVSYTWGGENGDSCLNQPVYIGPFWDILLQTHNCWEMLRHMRPWKGVRTIWVDAICINQTDMQERQAQVSKMGPIYEKASRVVIYLGPDLVSPTSTSSPYPRRHNLRDFDTLTEKPQLPSDSLINLNQWKLSDVLSREYFRRLWIIQELIMSKNITVRIGDTEFIVDHIISMDAVQVCNKPWFSFVTRKKLGDQSGNNLRAAVEFVAASRASDPRDKIFGILGLIDSGEHQIAANYSISFRHLVIGYYAYCLLTKRDIRVLLHASGLRAAEGMPSWVPLTRHDESRNEHIISSTNNLQLDWLYKSKDFLKMYSRHHSCRHLEGGVITVAYSSGLNQQTCFKIACEWISTGSDTFGILHQASENKRKGIPGYPNRKTFWHTHAALNNSTGAINLHATHIMSFGNIEFSQSNVDRNDEVHAHTLKAGTSTLHIYTNKCFLGPANEPGKIHLFMLYDNADNISKTEGLVGDSVEPKPRLCLLQQTSHDAKFQLVSASVIACFHSPRKVEHFPGPFYEEGEYTRIEFGDFRLASNVFVAYDNLTDSSLPLVRADGPAGIQAYKKTPAVPWDLKVENPNIHGLPSLDFGDLRLSLPHRIDHLRQLWAGLDGDQKRNDFFARRRVLDYGSYPNPRLAFTGVAHSSTFLAVFQSILDAERSSSPTEFFNVYFQAVRNFNPKLIQWDNQRRNNTDNSSRDERQVIELVQLKFEPDQYDVLEDILDLIQEDVKRIIEYRRYPYRKLDSPESQFNPPFLRVGWLDLTTHQTNDMVINFSLSNEDVCRFDLLDAIDEVMDGITAHYTSHAQDRLRYTKEEHYTNASLIETSGKRAYNDSIIRENKGQTMWVAFDLLSLTLWVQTHPYMGELRWLSRFCKDGENEMTRLLRPPAEEEKEATYSDWPIEVMENFEIDGELRYITII